MPWTNYQAKNTTPLHHVSSMVYYHRDSWPSIVIQLTFPHRHSYGPTGPIQCRILHTRAPRAHDKPSHRATCDSQRPPSPPRSLLRIPWCHGSPGIRGCWNIREWSHKSEFAGPPSFWRPRVWACSYQGWRLDGTYSRGSRTWWEAYIWEWGLEGDGCYDIYLHCRRRSAGRQRMVFPRLYGEQHE